MVILLTKYKVNFIINLLALLLLFPSCYQGRRLNNDEYLLDKVIIYADEKALQRNDLNSLLIQKPNKRILGGKFHLWVYNLANPNKDNKISNWLRKIGEEPVVYDPLLQKKSKTRLSKYLINKGYYNATVSDSTITRKKEKTIIYNVQANTPYKIKNIQYNITDTLLQPVIFPDTVNRLITTNDLFDLDVLNNERIRMEAMLNNKGYYYFTRDFISFQADTNSSKKNVSLNILVTGSNYSNDRQAYIPHKKYTFNNIFIHTNFNRRQYVQQKGTYLDVLDTTEVQPGIFVIAHKPSNINPSIIVQKNYLIPGDLFSQDMMQQTHLQLTSLPFVRQVNFDVYEHEQDSTGNWLDVNIFISQQKRLGFNFDSEFTYSSGDFGAGGSFNLKNRNLFKNAELFELKVYGEAEGARSLGLTSDRNLNEYGTELSLNIPKFLLPIKTSGYVKRFNPTTSLSGSYISQSGLYLRRNIANFSYAYKWSGNTFVNHTIKPLDLYYVDVLETYEGFDTYIANKRDQSSFFTHMIIASSYTLEYSNKQFSNTNNILYLKSNIESAGNILTSFHKLFNTRDTLLNYKLFGKEYAQYLKADVDLRFYHVLNPDNKLVYRLFGGVGVPYGNSKSLPDEKQYFTGGENSNRGWKQAYIGPGGFSANEKGRIVKADVKIEANFEYRFDMPWVLEGALFLDAGNVWNLRSYQYEPVAWDAHPTDADFSLSQFYKQLAVSTGTGFRFDFSFFILRFDLGFRIYNPNPIPSITQAQNGTRVIKPGVKFLLGNGKYNFNENFKVNFGIGYPF